MGSAGCRREWVGCDGGEEGGEGGAAAAGPAGGEGGLMDGCQNFQDNDSGLTLNVVFYFPNFFFADKYCRITLSLAKFYFA